MLNWIVALLFVGAVIAVLGWGGVAAFFVIGTKIFAVLALLVVGASVADSLVLDHRPTSHPYNRRRAPVFNMPADRHR